jgi:hypothetical protein
MALPSPAVHARFAEFGFCPLGGPPGWFNRITGQHRKKRFHPAAYYYPRPVYGVVPANSYYPVNYPVNPPANSGYWSFSHLPADVNRP